MQVMLRSASALLVSLSVLALVGCGSDAVKQAATATEGDAFCVAAGKVNTDSSELSNIILTGKPDEVKAVYTKLLAESNAALRVAPKDIKDAVAQSVDAQTKIGDALGKYNWDVLKAGADPAIKPLFDAADSSSKTVDAYLTSKCGIAPDSTDGTNSGNTVAGLSDSEAIDKLVDLYAVGASKTVTDTQRACLHTELDGKFTLDSLNAILSGGTMDTTEQQALGLAFVKCGLS